MQKEAKFDWRLALLPVKDGKNIRASSLGGYDFVIPKGAKEVDGAFQFIEFMSNPRDPERGLEDRAGWRRAPTSWSQDPQWPQAYAIYPRAAADRAPARPASAMAGDLARRSRSPSRRR